MKWFYISPFAVNVLSVAIIIFFIIYYLAKNQEKTQATKYLIVFLVGVVIVFISFVVIFSSLDYSVSVKAWWLLHVVVFSTTSMLQYAYNFPRNIHQRESKIVFNISIVSALSLLYYKNHGFKTHLQF